MGFMYGGPYLSVSNTTVNRLYYDDYTNIETI